ncbi:MULTISPECIES: hypothetical protein [Actinomadura]|uniref:hypothetical protein n=1 Tax=Actinomadura TaxID=1988 RepID=UPI0012FA8A2A|nr:MULTISPECIES: hypothetical protein [Actinomadura]
MDDGADHELADAVAVGVAAQPLTIDARGGGYGANVVGVDVDAAAPHVGVELPVWR